MRLLKLKNARRKSTQRRVDLLQHRCVRAKLFLAELVKARRIRLGVRVGSSASDLEKEAHPACAWFVKESDGTMFAQAALRRYLLQLRRQMSHECS